MKKLFSILLLIPALCFGAAQNDIAISRVLANGFSTQFDFVSTYKTGELQFIMFDGSGLVSTVRKVGSTITCNATTCDASGGSTVNWSSIVGTPSFATVAFTGAYADLLSKPTLFSGAYADLTGKPTLFSGAYADLASIPSTFTPAAHNQAFSTITGTPTTLAGYGISDGITSASLTTTLSSYATSSALGTGLAGKMDAPTGTSAQYIRGDATLATFPIIPAAPVNADWNASSGLAQILNKPSIPASQVQTDWNASSGLGVVLNKPSLATVATSGSYTDLSNKPTIQAIQRTRATTATDGTYTWTFPQAYGAGVIPVVTMATEGTASLYFQNTITAISNTAVSIKTTPIQDVTVLTIHVLGVSTAQAANVHLTAVAP